MQCHPLHTISYVYNGDMQILETRRLILRPIVKEDAPIYWRFFSDPETMRFYPSTRNLKETEQFVQRQLERYQQDGYGPWAMVLKSDSEMIGYCGLIHQIVDSADEMEIGYLVSRDYWGQGYATEAAIGSRDYAFIKLRTKRLISLIDPLNAASIAVARKVGMKLEKQTTWQGKRLNVYSMKRS
jgi:RimJ/RimL family protein N-acetyltransferase